MEDKIRRLDNDFKRNQENLNQALDRLKDEKKKEEIKERECNEQFSILQQKTNEILKKVICF